MPQARSILQKNYYTMSSSSKSEIDRSSLEDLRARLFNKHTEDQSLSQRDPSLFKWRTVTVILASLSVILLFIDAFVLYAVLTQQTIDINLTFVASIGRQTQILQTSAELTHLSDNFQTIYGTPLFQKATLVDRFDSLSIERIRKKVYYEQNEKLLYLIQVQSQNVKNEFAVFMNSPFPIPKDDTFDSAMPYYSFEILDERKSSVFSLKQKGKTLKFRSEEPQSPLNCKTYNFMGKENQGSEFALFNKTISFNMEGRKVQTSTSSPSCFSPNLNEADFKTLLMEIIGFSTVESQFSFVKAEVFYLN